MKDQAWSSCFLRKWSEENFQVSLDSGGGSVNEFFRRTEEKDVSQGAAR
jgi:hypothetical protein